MHQRRDQQPTPSPPTPGRTPPPTPDLTARTGTPGQDCCDRCGSVRLIRVKACWRCESCGYKSDCNGW
jgi:hypothetical protein